jgi:hypothetical protein
MRKWKWCLAAAALALAACGGGEPAAVTTEAPIEPPAAPGSPAGFWNGSTNDGKSIMAFVLPDGRLWGVQRPVAANAWSSVLDGQVNGTIHVMEIQGADHVVTETISVATVQPKSTLNLALTAGNTTSSFHGVYYAAFEQPPALAAAAGAYEGTWAGLTEDALDGVLVTLDDNGDFEGQLAPGCTFGGTLVPRSDANLFDATIIITAASCNDDITFTGVGTYSSDTNQLTIIAATAARDAHLIFIGTKP